MATSGISEVELKSCKSAAPFPRVPLAAEGYIPCWGGGGWREGREAASPLARCWTGDIERCLGEAFLGGVMLMLGDDASRSRIVLLRTLGAETGAPGEGDTVKE